MSAKGWPEDLLPGERADLLDILAKALLVRCGGRVEFTQDELAAAARMDATVERGPFKGLIFSRYVQ